VTAGLCLLSDDSQKPAVTVCFNSTQTARGGPLHYRTLQLVPANRESAVTLAKTSQGAAVTSHTRSPQIPQRRDNFRLLWCIPPALCSHLSRTEANLVCDNLSMVLAMAADSSFLNRSLGQLLPTLSVHAIYLNVVSFSFRASPRMRLRYIRHHSRTPIHTISLKPYFLS